MVSEVLFSSKSDEWETPQDLFSELNEEFKFTLDVCATSGNAKCDRYYTKEYDGLSKNWFGETIFCNPPYSQISEWVHNCYFWNGHGVTCVMLLPVRTDTKWFHNYIYNNSNCEIRFLKGRLKFSNSKNSAPFPSMIAIFKHRGIM